MRIYVSFMRPCPVLSESTTSPLQLPQFMRPGQIHPCRRVHIVLKHKILHRSWIYSTMRRRMNAWKLDDTFMFMIVVVWWYFYDVGPHSFCHLTPSCPITLSEISRRCYLKRFTFCAIWCPGHIFYNQKNDSILERPSNRLSIPAIQISSDKRMSTPKPND